MDEMDLVVCYMSSHDISTGGLPEELESQVLVSVADAEPDGVELAVLDLDASLCQPVSPFAATRWAYIR